MEKKTEMNKEVKEEAKFNKEVKEEAKFNKEVKGEARSCANPDPMVPFFRPRLSATEEDLVVWVNKKRYTIKKGVQVDIPKSVYEVIMNSERMKMVAMEYEAAHGIG